MAYKDLEIQMKNDEKKIDEKKNMSGKTKAESERLGMGFGNCRRYVSPLSRGRTPASLLILRAACSFHLQQYFSSSFLSDGLLYASVDDGMKTSKSDS